MQPHECPARMHDAAKALCSPQAWPATNSDGMLNRMTGETSSSSVPGFEWSLPTQVVFGWGRSHELARWIQPLGRRAFLVSGSGTLETNGTIPRLIQQLESAGIEVIRLAAIDHEPLVTDVDSATGRLLRQSPSSGDVVLAIGGGSAIDLGKAVAAMATNRQSDTVGDYLENVGRGLQVEHAPLPIVAVPTTAGTGSEATRNAVISSLDPPFKKSLRSPLMIPRLALVDPELTCSTSPRVTAWCGLDAVTQLVESYVSRRASPMTRGLCLSVLPGILDALKTAVLEGQSRWARERMSQAALISGMALANSGLGMAHGVAAALGVHCRLAHGLACAVILPVAIEVNRSVVGHELATLARLILDQPAISDDAAIDALLATLRELYASIGIPLSLSKAGVNKEVIPELVRGSRGSSMSGNPRQLSDDDLREVLEAHW